MAWLALIAYVCVTLAVSSHGMPQGAPKLKVAIIGGGLAGLSTAAELLDQG